jgi:hypothetical protein
LTSLTISQFESLERIEEIMRHMKIYLTSNDGWILQGRET